MSTLSKLLLPLALAAAITACSKPADTAAPAATPAETAAAPAEAAAAAPAAPEAAAIQIAAGTYKLDPSHTDVLEGHTHQRPAVAATQSSVPTASQRLRRPL